MSKEISIYMHVDVMNRQKVGYICILQYHYTNLTQNPKCMKGSICIGSSLLDRPHAFLLSVYILLIISRDWFLGSRALGSWWPRRLAKLCPHISTCGSGGHALFHLGCICTCKLASVRAGNHSRVEHGQ